MWTYWGQWFFLTGIISRRWVTCPGFLTFRWGDFPPKWSSGVALGWAQCIMTLHAQWGVAQVSRILKFFLSLLSLDHRFETLCCLSQFKVPENSYDALKSICLKNLALAALLSFPPIAGRRRQTSACRALHALEYWGYFFLWCSQVRLLFRNGLNHLCLCQNVQGTINKTIACSVRNKIKIVQNGKDAMALFLGRSRIGRSIQGEVRTRILIGL